MEKILPFVEQTWLQVLLLAQQNKLIFSVLLLLFLIWIKRFVVKLVRKRSTARGEDRRHQINLFKQLYNALLLLVLLLIWSSEVQEFAISIAAFMVGIVLATRDFIQCIVGFIYYISARPFRVGDWIQIDKDKMGIVREIDWAKVALLEVDPHNFEYTGKHMYVPNSRLVSQTIRNLNFLNRYMLHEFDLVIEPKVNAYELLPQLLERARHHCEHFRDVAERYKGLIERNLDAEFIEVDPEVTIETNELANIVVKVALFCPTNEAKEIQQKISADFMTLLFNARSVESEQAGVNS